MGCRRSCFVQFNGHLRETGLVTVAVIVFEGPPEIWKLGGVKRGTSRRQIARRTQGTDGATVSEGRAKLAQSCEIR